MYEFSPSGEVVAHDGLSHIAGLSWVDGGTVLVSRYREGVCQTYRVHPDGMLTVDAETAAGVRRRCGSSTGTPSPIWWARPRPVLRER